MLVTKEEKKIYSFLDIVYMLFGKALGRKVLFGHDGDLYFYCEGYAGYFKQDDYVFKTTRYSIGKTPDANYVLEVDGEIEMLESSSASRIDQLLANHSKRLEIASKTEECKIAKIAADTDFWLKDDDLKILMKYRFFMVKIPREEEDLLIISEDNTVYSSNIIFNFDCSYSKAATQLTFDTVESDEEKPVVVISSKEQLEALKAEPEEQELDNLMQEAIQEESEDEFDPMV